MAQSDMLPCGGMGPAWGGGNVPCASHHTHGPWLKLQILLLFGKQDSKCWTLGTFGLKCTHITQTQMTQEFSVNLNAILSVIEV